MANTIDKIRLNGTDYAIGGSGGASMDDVRDLMSCDNKNQFITLRDVAGWNGNTFEGSGVYLGGNLCYSVDTLRFDANYSNRQQYDNFIVNKDVVDEYADPGYYGYNGRFMCLLFTKEQAESFLASNDSRINDNKWASIYGLTDDVVSGKIYKYYLDNNLSGNKLQTALNDLNNYHNNYKYIAYIGDDWYTISSGSNKLTWNGMSGYCNKFSIVVGIMYSYGMGSNASLWSVIDPIEGIVENNVIATFDKSKVVYDGCTIADRLSSKQNALNTTVVTQMGADVYGNLYYYDKDSQTLEDKPSKSVKVAKINGETIVDNNTQKDLQLQPTLVSGSNIKTVNGESLLGSGNIEIQGGGGSSNIVELTQQQYDDLEPKDPDTMYVISDAEPVDVSGFATKDELKDKQDKMTGNYLSKVDVGGSSISIETKAFVNEAVQKTDTINFKTINGNAIFGMGDIKIEGGGGSDAKVWTVSNNILYSPSLTVTELPFDEVKIGDIVKTTENRGSENVVYEFVIISKTSSDFDYSENCRLCMINRTLVGSGNDYELIDLVTKRIDIGVSFAHYNINRTKIGSSAELPSGNYYYDSSFNIDWSTGKKVSNLILKRKGFNGSNDSEDNYFFSSINGESIMAQSPFGLIVTNFELVTQDEFNSAVGNIEELLSRI